MRVPVGGLATAFALAAVIPLSAAVAAQDDSVTLTLLHNNDGESSLSPLDYGVAEGVTLEVGGAAAFKAVIEREIADARSRGHSVLNVYAGDSFLASAILACSQPEDPAATDVPYDALAQAQMPYDVHVFGNHEFDYGPDFLRRYVAGFGDDAGLTQPFISANLDFSAQAGWADWIDADGVLEAPVDDDRIVGQAVVVTDAETGETFGVIGATTELLPVISSPGEVAVGPAAAAVQTEIDALLESGVDKIIFVSHLQGVDADQAILAELSGVDVAVAGGGDELLVNDEAELLPGEDPEDVFGSYPLYATDADGKQVPIVTTAGNYKYLGRVDLIFDAAGNVTEVVGETSHPRRVIPLEQADDGLLDELGVSDAVASDPGIISSVLDPLDICLGDLASTPVAVSQVVFNVDRGQWDPAEDIYSPGVRSGNTNGGNLIADSFIASYDAYAQSSGLEARSPDNLVVAVQNGGGIRQNGGPVLPVGGEAGAAISQLDTINVLPFDNTVVVVQDLAVADLAAVLELSCTGRGGGAFLQPAALSYTCDYTKDEGSRLSDVAIDAGDGTSVTIVDSSGSVDGSVASIDVITNSFTAGGGDGYDSLGAAESVKLVADGGEQVYYERALREYLESFTAGDEGVPLVPADDPRYAEEEGERPHHVDRRLAASEDQHFRPPGAGDFLPATVTIGHTVSVSPFDDARPRRGLRSLHERERVEPARRAGTGVHRAAGRSDRDPGRLRAAPHHQHDARQRRARLRGRGDRPRLPAQPGHRAATDHHRWIGAAGYGHHGRRRLLPRVDHVARRRTGWLLGVAWHRTGRRRRSRAVRVRHRDRRLGCQPGGTEQRRRQLAE